MSSHTNHKTTSSLDEDSCSTQSREKTTKVCGVCGDFAKSYHFGGICCDSCKAFFRRTIQSESWETFLCVNGGKCEITQERRSCQACRFELCKKIGMDSSLVMSIEERKALMLRKLERKKRQLLKKYGDMEQQLDKNKQQDSFSATSKPDEEHRGTNMECDESRATESMEEIKMDCTKENDSDDCLIIETLTQHDKEKIKRLQKLLRRAMSIPEFPKHYYEEGADITEHLFFVFCKSMGKFYSFVPEFQVLENQDKNFLLKGAVAKAIFIFGAHQFQEENETWPRKLLSPFCAFPTVSLASTEKFIDDGDTFLKLKKFMRKFCRFFDDEVVTLLSLMIAVFDQDDPILISPSKIAESRENYTQLLENYLQHQNSTMSVILFTSELWNCFSEVKELAERFQKGSSQDKGKKSLTEKDDSSFASSLHKLGEDPKMPPKKAFFERIRVRENLCASDMPFENFEKTPTLREEQFIKDKNTTMTLENPQMSYSTVTQDHDYQKPNAMDLENVKSFDRISIPDDDVQVLLDHRPTTTYYERRIPPSSLSEIQLPRRSRPTKSDVLYDSTNYTGKDHRIFYERKEFPSNSSRLTPPALLIPISRTRQNSQLESQRLSQSQNLNSISENASFEYFQYSERHPDVCSAEQREGIRLNAYRQLLTQVPQLGAKELPQSVNSRKQHQYFSSDEMSPSQMEALHRLGLKAVPFCLPGEHFTHAQSNVHGRVHPEHLRQMSEIHQSQAPYQGIQKNIDLSHYSKGKSLADQPFYDNLSYPSSSRPSSVSSTSSSFEMLPNQDDEQLVQAVQDVLPPHLVKRLINRLGVEHRETL